MRSPQLVIVGSAFILCALLSHSFLGESVEQGPSEHAQHLRDVVQEKVAEHPQGNNNANSNANANTNNPPPAVHHPSPAPMALLQPQGSGAYEAAGGDDTPKIPPSASVGSAPILTWADFTAKIGCGNGIRAPLTSAQGGSEVVISDVLKLSECHVNNMEEPPFYKSDVTNGLVIDVGANDGVDYAGPGARKGHLVYSFEPFAATALKFVEQMKGFGFTIENGGLTVVDIVPGQKAEVPRGLLDRVKKTNKGHVVLFKAAAGAETSSMAVPVNRVDEVNTLIKGNSDDLGSIVSSETIAVIKLDDVIVPEDPVFLFKMDAQGYEPTVLDGASRVLMENSPSILTFEFWPKGIDRGVGQDPKEMLTHLWDSGYHCFDWSTNMHIPDSRPSDVVGFVNSFYDLGNFPGSKCQSQTCQGFGLWDELVCAKL